MLNILNAYWPFCFFFWELFIQYTRPLIEWVVGGLGILGCLFVCVRSLHGFGCYPLSELAAISSVSGSCLFTLLIASIALQKLFNFMNSTYHLGLFPVLLSLSESPCLFLCLEVFFFPLQQFQCFRFYIKIFDPFWTDSLCKVKYSSNFILCV